MSKSRLSFSKLCSYLTIVQNIAFGMVGEAGIERNNKIMQLLDKLHLLGLENRYPHQISGGQQQRVALARTLATEPEIILLDEPFSALDEYLRSHLTKELIGILREFKGNALFVTHNMAEAYRICDKLVVLSDGRVHAFGSKREVFANPKTSDAARITGCKNIVAANRIDEEYLEIPAWNIKLKANVLIRANSGFC